MSGAEGSLLRDEVRARTNLAALIGERVVLKRRGCDWWGCCPFHREKTPSFKVNVERGVYYCFGCSESGDAFAWVMKMDGLSFREALKVLAIRAGLQADDRGVTYRKAPEVVQQASQTEDERSDMERLYRARKLWERCRQAAGSPVETYLEGRGIKVARLPGGVLPVALRYHHTLFHGPSKLQLPGMVAAVRNGEGHLVGVHRTFLQNGGVAKSKVRPAKMMLGVCGGGAVRLCETAPILGLAEGIETALSVMAASGLPCWAAGSLGNLAAVALPPLVREVILCADGDGDQRASRAALAAANQFYGERGLKVRIAQAAAGTDFNDMLRGVA